MKPHLPISLLFALLSSTLLPFAHAAYTTPTKITIPPGYTSVRLDGGEETAVAEYFDRAEQVAFRIKGDLLFDGLNTQLMSASAASRYFTSNSVDNLVSLTFRNATERLFSIKNSRGTELRWGNLNELTFENNYSGVYGGGVFFLDAWDTALFFDKNKRITFSNNSSNYDGGVIGSYVGFYNRSGTVSFSKNDSVYFYGNSTSTDKDNNGGGAIIVAELKMQGNTSIMFESNRSNFGGAVYSASTANLSGNGTLTFAENMASTASASYAPVGGAIYSNNGSLSINGNTSVSFRANEASVYANTSSSKIATARGGAIHAKGGVSVELCQNGTVAFIDNTVISYSAPNTVLATGGAISCDPDESNTVGLSLSDNHSVIFRGNSVTANSSSSNAQAYGGAVYIGKNGSMIVRNNGSVLFEKNAEVENDSYRLRSIYGESFVTLELGAAAGNKVEFRDGICLGTGSTLNINSTYKDEEEVQHSQSGDVLLTGAYTAQHLQAVKGSAGTTSEIKASRVVDANDKVNVYGGSLRIEDGMVLKGNYFTAAEKSNSVTALKDAGMEFDDGIIFNSGTTLTVQGNNSIEGDLTFGKNSNLQLKVSKANKGTVVLTHSGSLTLQGALTVKLEQAEPLNSGEYILLETDDGKPGNWTSKNISVSCLNDWNVGFSDLYWSGNTLYLNYESEAVWSNAAGNRQWNTSSSNWVRDGGSYVYQNGKRVRFENTGSGTVSLVGTLTPKSVTVNNGSGYNYTWQGSGKLAGAMKLTKKGAGTLTIKNTNTYTGGTAISGGTVVLGANNALGSGAITLSNATLNMGGKIVSNNLTLSGSSKILSGTNYRGNFTMNGNLLAGSSISIISGKTATLKKGNVGGSISGAGNTVINGAVTLNGGKIATNKLTISGSGKKLTANASGLVMNKNASDITLSASGNLTSAGAITARNITLSNKAVLNAKNSAVRNITLGGKLQATDSTVNMFGNLTAGNLVLTRSTLTNNGSSVRNLSLSGALTLSSATLNHYGNISAKNVTATASGIRQTGGPTGMKLSGNLSLGSKSTLNLFGTLNAANVTLSGNSVLNNANSTVRNAVVKGKLQATNSTVNLHGNLTAGNVVLNNATLRDNGSSARAVTVTNSTSLSNNAKLNIKGYLRSKNLTLNKSSLRQHSNNSGVALTGTLTMNSGSTLTAQGALSAANMKLSGGTINLTSASFSTIKVSGTLTLSSAIDLNLGCKLTTGRNYTLISFAKSNLTRSSNLTKLLGLTGSGATLTLRSTGITLKVTNAAAWNKYLSANKTAFNKAASVVNAMTPAAEESEVVEIAADTATTVAAEPAYDRSSADMLVQSNWGVVNASRAFTDTLGNRASNSTAFGADKSSAVWLSAIGASSRLSSDGAAAGSDYNLYGAAVGMEQQLTEKSSLGLAIGESYGKVNSFTSARTKQDTLHTALYGQYSAVERSRDAVLLDWSAAYGRTESKWQGTEWEQKSVQLDARATWAHQLTADTTVSGFAGMQYFASESADIAPGIKSGSVQNLRGELGVGVGHKLTGKTRLFSELSFVGDMVRHNPTADMGGVRERGSNPGRAGINFSVGGTHAINDKWSVNASYNLELMERANSHSANIGTSYRF